MNTMTQKVNTAILALYLTVTNKLSQWRDEEDGMETVQAIILIVVGVVIVAALIAIVGDKDKEGTLLNRIWKLLDTLIGKGETQVNK